jgi:NADH-quinone oxidoreductase subunit J
MTSRPELRDDTGALVPGLAAVGLFVVMAAVFVGAPVGDAAGIPANAEVANESIGDADLQSNASITSDANGTYVLVQRSDGNETTQLTSDSNVNATLVTSGDQLYGVVSEPVSVTESIGYAMFGLNEQLPADLQGESFLAVFEIIDLVLVAALVGAVMLARREGAGTVVALFSSAEDEASAGAGAMAADGGVESVDGDDGALEDAERDGGDA